MGAAIPTSVVIFAAMSDSEMTLSTFSYVGLL